jgi:putative lipoprotein
MKARSRAPAWAAAPVAAALCLAPGSARAADPDPWFGPDKALHLTVSTLVAGAGYGMTSLFTDRIAARMAFGAGLGVAVGAGKELLDLTGFGDPSWKDFTWDVIGTAVGIGIAVTIDLAVQDPRPARAR